MFKNVLKLLISIGVLAVLFSKVDLLHFSNIMRNLEPIFVLSAVAIQFVLSIIQTERWRIILRAGKIRIRLVGAWLNVMIGLCFNQVLPSSVGGDAIRVYNARSLGLGIALRSILIDRLIALFTLSILSFFICCIFYFIGLPIGWFWLLFMIYASATFYACMLPPPLISGSYYAFKYSSESEANPPPIGFF